MSDHTPRDRRPLEATKPMAVDSTGERFERLVEIMRTLRAPGGCPWDRAQTVASLRPFVLEETYEVLEAIDRARPAELASELGDLLLQVVFIAQLESETGRFTIADVLEAICDKLVRRHPHVFDRTPGDDASQPRTPGDVVDRWQQLKAQEREAAGERAALLGGIPAALPALLRAYQISSRAASVGFDWADVNGVLEKLAEELDELNRAVAHEGAERAEEEMGDVLFAVANVARKLGIEPEAALRGANERFSRRFGAIERRITQGGRALVEASSDELEAAWRHAKAEIAPDARPPRRGTGEGGHR